MMKEKYIYAVFGIVFVSLLMSSVNSLAWKNGDRKVQFYDPGHPTPINEYWDDWYDLTSPPTNIKKKYYGTHDWIAESALELLYNLRPNHAFLSKLWGDPVYNDYLRIYFLYGTELPDVATETSSVIPGNFKTRCNYYFKEHDFLPDHNPITFVVGGIPDRLDTPNYAQIMGQRIQSAFKQKDCQKAAAFIGALMHAIADATFYPHILQTTATDNEFKTHVDYVTYKTWALGDRILDNPTKEFFSLKIAKDKLKANTFISPYFAAFQAGYFTYSPSIPYKNANWMEQEKPTVANRNHWNSVDGPWTNHNQQLAWFYNMRPSLGDANAYFNTLEYNLNMAVYYCAAALNFILETVPFEGCGCSGENPPPGGQNPPVGDDVKDKEGIKLALDETQALMFFSFAGLAASMLALTLQKFLVELIEKGIPLKFL